VRKNEQPQRTLDKCRIAKKALRAYGMSGCELEFFRHNENLVYRVDDPSRS
jgi:hypothetical protein